MWKPFGFNVIYKWWVNTTSMFFFRLVYRRVSNTASDIFSDSHRENYQHINTHDGSMVLLYIYMVCHGSHQYTPNMLALIYQHHGSVMGHIYQQSISSIWAVPHVDDCFLGYTMLYHQYIGDCHNSWGNPFSPKTRYEETLKIRILNTDDMSCFPLEMANTPNGQAFMAMSIWTLSSISTLRSTILRYPFKTHQRNPLNYVKSCIVIC